MFDNASNSFIFPIVEKTAIFKIFQYEEQHPTYIIYIYEILPKHFLKTFS